VVGADEGLLDEKVTLLFLSNDDEWERGAGRGGGERCEATWRESVRENLGEKALEWHVGEREVRRGSVTFN
jgi:hypothetical protein